MGSPSASVSNATFPSRIKNDRWNIFSTDWAKSWGLMTNRNKLMGLTSPNRPSNCIYVNSRTKKWLTQLTSATFLVVSFSDRAISSSFSSWGLRCSSLFFSNLARLTAARFLTSIESGPSLEIWHYHLSLKVGRNTDIKLRAGTLWLFASAFRPILPQSRTLSGSSSAASISESSSGIWSPNLRPPMKVMSFETNSSTSKAPAPDFMARAFCAPRLEAISKKAESRVASWGPFTTKGLSREKSTSYNLTCTAYLCRRACLPCRRPFQSVLYSSWRG